MASATSFDELHQVRIEGGPSAMELLEVSGFFQIRKTLSFKLLGEDRSFGFDLFGLFPTRTKDELFLVGATGQGPFVIGYNARTRRGSFTALVDDFLIRDLMSCERLPFSIEPR